MNVVYWVCSRKISHISISGDGRRTLCGRLAPYNYFYDSFPAGVPDALRLCKICQRKYINGQE